MGTDEESRVRLAAAERYESELAATILLKTATHLIDRADVEPGMSVLDVGCGTGVVARECLRRTGANGPVIGVDIDREMLAVADRVAPDVGWVQGDAGMLPFPAEHFDRVLSQFALMFFPDQEHALGEMWRVLKPGGRLVMAVSGALRDSPVNLELADLVERHVGEKGRAVVEEIWTSGIPELEDTLNRAGVTPATLTVEYDTTEYPSIEAFAETEIRGWAPLSELVDDATLDSLVDDARRELAPHLSGDGHLRFISPYNMAVAVKAAS